MKEARRRKTNTTHSSLSMWALKNPNTWKQRTAWDYQELGTARTGGEGWEAVGQMVKGQMERCCSKLNFSVSRGNKRSVFEAMDELISLIQSFHTVWLYHSIVLYPINTHKFVNTGWASLSLSLSFSMLAKLHKEHNEEGPLGDRRAPQWSTASLDHNLRSDTSRVQRDTHELSDFGTVCISELSTSLISGLGMLKLWSLCMIPKPGQLRSLRHCWFQAFEGRLKLQPITKINL